MSYDGVLKSARWSLLKWRRLCQAGFSCERCGRRYMGKDPRKATGLFELHHRHYRSVGAETLEDVQIVCPDCHAAIHGL